MAKSKRKIIKTKSGKEISVLKNASGIKAYDGDKMIYSSLGDNNSFQRWLREN
jgi:hypothetical protein